MAKIAELHASLVLIANAIQGNTVGMAKEQKAIVVNMQIRSNYYPAI